MNLFQMVIKQMRQRALGTWLTIFSVLLGVAMAVAILIIHREAQNIFVQRDAFVVAQSSVQLNIALVKRLGAGFFGGEGFILEQLTGPGTLFIHAGGDFIEFTLAAGESLQIDTGCIVAFDETVDYDIQLAGGIRTALFGGEGLFLATLTGPGRVIVQSLTLQKMRRELAPYRTGGDEHKGLDIISGIFNSDD